MTNTTWGAMGVYYEPIPYYNGSVLKCAGGVNEQNKTWMLAKPGMIILPHYIADRITADTHKPFTSL